MYLILSCISGNHGNGIYHNIYLFPGSYLKYIPVVSFEVRCQSGILFVIDLSSWLQCSYTAIAIAISIIINNNNDFMM